MSPAQKDIRACLDPSRNVLVEACAGSGKTWLLTSRIIRALLADKNLEPAQILAITFTNAAVAEISHRVQERLREARYASDKLLDELLTQLHLSPSPKLREAARGLYARLEMKRPRLQVSTFHGWFMHMERAMPWSARTTITHHVLGNDQLVREEAWQAFLEAAAADNADAEITKALQAMLARHKPDPLQAMLDTLLDKRVAWEIHYKAPPTDEDACKRFLEEMEKSNKPSGSTAEEIIVGERIWECLRLLVEQAKEDSGTINTTTQNFIDKASYACEMRGEKNAAKGSSDAALIEDVKDATLTQKGKPRQHLKNSFGDSTELLGELQGIFTAIDVWDNWLRVKSYNHDAIVLGRAYASHYERRKRELGGCDYADIELTALRALGDPDCVTDIALRLNKTYKHILIDEFQDTSPGQWEVMRNWLEACHGGDQQPGVFIVGDPKQSIYGFQGGDPEVLRVATKFLQERYQGTHVRFNTTRRCAQPVIDVVNEVFDQASDGAVFLDGFKQHDTLQEELPGSVMALDLVKRKSSKSTATEKLRDPLVQAPEEETASPAALEGARMAELLREIIDKWEIIDERGEPRACRPGDIMLLYPSSTSAAEIVHELARADIACTAPKSKNRLCDLECQDMIALLRAIYDPADGYSVARVLRSPVFGVDENDLQAVFEAGRDWFRGLRDARGSDELRRAQEMLAKWRGQYLRGKLPAHETLAACYHDADIVARYVRSAPKELARRVANNLEWVLNYAIEADGGEHAQLAEYADFLQRLAGLDNFSEGEKEAKSEDMVLATTVHGAKGLESPVVVVSNSFAMLRSEARAGLLVGWANDEKLGTRRPDHFSFFWYKDTATQEQLESLERNQQSRSRDANNLLYVALTRAKQALVVSAKDSKNRTLEWHVKVQEALERCGATKQGDNLRLGKLPLATSYGSLSEDAQEEVLDASTIQAVGSELEPPSPAARHGTLLHDLLALTLAGVTSKNEQAGFLGVFDAELDKLRDQASKILAGKKIADLLARRTSLEMELAIVDAKEELKRIDCVLGTKDEVWVLDFKSAQKPDVDRYRDQLQSYRDALRASGETRTLRMGLVGGTGGLVEVN